MAISLVFLDMQVPGAAKQGLAEITLDASYPTGGYAVTPATFGLSILDYFVPLSTSGGYDGALDNAGR